METWYERLKKRMDELGLSQSAVWRAVGVSNATMSAWVSGKIKPNGENLSKLSKVLRVSQDWLLYGTERRPDGQDPPRLAAPVNVEPANLGELRIPRISYVTAGRWQEMTEPYAVGDEDGALYTNRSDLSSRVFALRIKGESMLPTFADGDDVIIDPCVQPRPGDFVVAKNHREEATFKKFRPRGIDQEGRDVFELVPLNEDYETLRSDRQPIVVIGVMVEHRRYRRSSS